MVDSQLEIYYMNLKSIKLCPFLLKRPYVSGVWYDII